MFETVAAARPKVSSALVSSMVIYSIVYRFVRRPVRRDGEAGGV